MIKNYRRKVFHYEVAKLVIIDGFMLAWLIYGNKLYWSDDNDCDRHESTRDLS